MTINIDIVSAFFGFVVGAVFTVLLYIILDRGEKAK